MSRPGSALVDRLEGRVRESWHGSPMAPLRIASAAFATAAGVRNLLYDAGVFAARRASVPVVSVGGLTVGGSGKTPIAADLGRRLAEAGVATAIVTHGYPDEIDVHRQLSPAVTVLGGRDRLRCARAAAEAGARMVVLDSGFSHRRMHRDLDIVTLDEATLGLGIAALPSGPYREGLASLARADLIVAVRRTVGREDPPPQSSPVSERIGAWCHVLAGQAETPPVLTARIRPGKLLPANAAARNAGEPKPAVAVAGIMWPEVFFRQVRRIAPSVRETVGLRDHVSVTPAVAGELRELAGNAGIVCTLKDATKLSRAVEDAVPVWYLSEHVAWEEPAPRPAVVTAALALLDREGAVAR